MTKRRKFSPEFKCGAIEQASQLGVTCAQVTRNSASFQISFLAGNVKQKK